MFEVRRTLKLRVKVVTYPVSSVVQSFAVGPVDFVSMGSQKNTFLEISSCRHVLV
jgi:hypothetical protein